MPMRGAFGGARARCVDLGHGGEGEGVLADHVLAGIAGEEHLGAT